jgi:hypothetical protein
VSIDH